MTKTIVAASEFSKIFWFETQRLRDEEQYKYHLYGTYHYENNLNIQKVKEALQATVNTNYNLRSNFIFEGNLLKQVIQDYAKANIVIYQAQTVENAKQYLHDETVRPFDLGSGALYRFVIVENQYDGTYSVLLNFHHIILDGTQFDRIIREIETHYHNPQPLDKSDKEEIELLQQYISWEQTQISKADIQSLANSLKTHTLAVTLPYNSAVNESLDKTISSSFVLDAKQYQKLKDFTQQTGFSVFNTLKAIWATLLSRYTNQEELVLSYPSNTRKAEFKEVKGCFVNTLYEAFTINNDTFKTVLELGKKNIALVRSGSAHLISPITLRKSVDISQVNCSISMISTRYQGPRLAGMVSQNEPIYPMSGSEIVFYFDDNGEDLFLQFRMIENVFNPTIFKHIGSHFEHCLASLIDNYDSIPVANANLISQDEYDKVIVQNNETDKPFSAEKTIHQLFEEQVKRTPDNIALVFEQTKLSYQQLNERANSLANYLKQKHHIVPDTLVAVCLDRSEHMLITILAILKAGGAYVPIEPSFPEERIQYLLQDTAAQLLITNEKFEQRLVGIAASASVSCSILAVDTESTNSLISAYSTENPNTVMTSKHLAYVIYTSGTTGKPKGAMLNHTGIVNRIEWMQNEYDLNPNDHVLQKTPYTFDVSVWELFWAHWYGGCIVFARPDGHKDSNYLSEIIQKEQISIMHFVPSMLDMYLEHLVTFKQTFSPHLRYIFCSGEALTLDQVNKFERAKRASPGAQVVIHNLYGPTEASVDVTYYACLSSQSKIPIGKPIQNIRLYILDKSLKPVPDGIVGELFISGIGLARGYLNRPELTDERFILNPFATEKDIQAGYERMYKTGDLVQWMPDGNIDYLGRNDSQIKLRGLRIELGEIESNLSQYEAVKQAVVLVKERNKSDKYLAAYYVAANAIDEGELRQHLGQTLPEYMIPSVFIHLDSFPLSNNGKLDRKALPEPSFSSSGESFVAPRNSLEEEVCRIWQDVLGIEKIGISDNFFRLGGDSILCIRIVSEMNQLGLNCSVRDIFQYNTIEHLVPAVSQGARENNSAYKPFSLLKQEKLKQLHEVDQLEDAYPVSYLQAGMLLEGELTEEGSYHDVFCYTIHKHFDETSFLSVWDKLIAKHSMLRTSFVVDSENGYIALQHKKVVNPQVRHPERSEGSQIVPNPGDPSRKKRAQDDVTGELQKVTNAKYIIDDNASIESILKTEKLEKFDYADPGLFRFLILDRKAEQFTLVFSFHHVIGDGWSIASLISEFVDLYVHDKPIDSDSALPSYGEFVAHEKAGVANQQIQAFWQDYLNDYNYIKRDLRLNNEVDTSEDVHMITRILDEDKSARMVALSHKLGVSVDMLFLSAYQLLLSTFFNNDDLIIGLVVNNRLEKVNGEKMFGLFLNTIPLRMKIDKNDIFQLVKQNYEEKIKLYQYKIYPYGKIKADLNLQDDAYQCAFNYIHFHIAENNYSNGSLEFTDRFEKTNIPLFLNVLRQSEQFEFSITGSNDFVDAKTLEKLVSYLNDYLLQLIDEKEKLSSLSAEEYQYLVHDINQNSAFYESDKTLHQLFEEQALITPDDIALVFEDQKLTFKQLNEEANQLARYIKKHYPDMQAEGLIPLCVDRSLDMVIGILGILKVGAAYVPIFPEYPQERIQYILEDTNAALIVTQSHIQKTLSSDQTRQMIALDQKPYANELSENITTHCLSTHLAYVIYTSGTTGNPKGVMVEHKSVVNTITDLKAIYKINQQEKKISCFTSFVFDVSVSEMFASLLQGGELHLFSEDVKRSPELLSHYINDSKLNFVYLPPAILSVLPRIDYPSIKCLIFAGEPCDKNVGLYWLSKYPFYNYYGPTETTIYATGKRVEARNINEIGKPLQNLQAYILDKDLNPVPMGVIAELYVGGVGVARGYFNRPELSAERFIPNPFGPDRLYKTGDLARMLPDGNIEYLGRNDSQVKIRGFRIELGEVENAISKLESISQSCVLALDIHGTKELVCYYTTSDLELKDQTLKQKLKEHLPDYMVPTYWKQLSSMPVTVNGKLDLRKLAALPLDLKKSEVNIEDATLLQKDILAIWQAVLSRQDIGLDDNFFDVGGHSLKVIHLKMKLEEEFSFADIGTADLFKYPTINSFCEYLLGNSKTIPNIYKSSGTDGEDEIAIIGISGAFSGSNSVDEYWHNISAGNETIEFLSIEQCHEKGVDPLTYENENYIPAAGHVAEIDKFDPYFWGLSPNESRIMDPQIRNFLEHSWAVLETTGYIKTRKQNNIGVFCGASPSYYMNQHILNNYDKTENINHWEANSMQGNSYLATRVSYFLGLTGPAMNINTACSTSLVSIVEACEKLASGKCDLALAGGVSLLSPEQHGHIYQEGMIFSKDGHCCPFDQGATGTTNGSGVGVLLLKRLSDAVRDGDPIIATIKGYATNNDGQRKVGYTAPSVIGQAECILTAQKQAGFTADTIAYVECHGTGTKLGDPIEVAALSDAFNSNLPEGKSIDCILGSVKANIGHTDSAAGVAGVIKVCKMLENQTIPPQINYKALNTEIKMDQESFKLITEKQEWTEKDYPRRAAVSSFGIGGTNAHIILQEYV